MQKSLQGASNISQKVLCVLEWYLARGLKGTWNNGNIDSWSVKFFVSDYAHHAWGFGLWVLAKKGLLVAAITVLDGRNSAIMSIIVLTIDLLLCLRVWDRGSNQAQTIHWRIRTWTANACCNRIQPFLQRGTGNWQNTTRPWPKPVGCLNRILSSNYLP